MDGYVRILFVICSNLLIIAGALAIIVGLYLIVSNPFGWTEEFKVNKQQQNVETNQLENVLDKNGDPVMVIKRKIYHRSTCLEGLGIIIGGIVGGIVSYLVLLWWRLLSLAFIEWIRVSMDNESNTRKALE